MKQNENHIFTSNEYVLLSREQVSTQTITCDMCGYENPKEKELCEKCSNYLKG